MRVDSSPAMRNTQFHQSGAGMAAPSPPSGHRLFAGAGRPSCPVRQPDFFRTSVHV
jgi:hypothetical protein